MIKKNKDFDPKLFFYQLFAWLAILTMIVMEVGVYIENDKAYQKGFEDGQKNAPNNLTSYTITEILDSFESMGNYSTSLIITESPFEECKGETFIICGMSGRTVKVKSDGTWSASWRNNG